MTGFGVMIKSDGLRAFGAVLVSVCLGAGLVHAAPQLREAGFLPAATLTPAISEPQQELVYAIINMTEEMDARMACPLDLGLARSRVEAGLKDKAVHPVYSPIAQGPDVLTHEISARLNTEKSECLWTTVTLYAGRLNQPHHDLPDMAYSSLEMASRNASVGNAY